MRYTKRKKRRKRPPGDFVNIRVEMERRNSLTRRYRLMVLVAAVLTVGTADSSAGLLRHTFAVVLQDMRGPGNAQSSGGRAQGGSESAPGSPTRPEREEDGI